MKARVRLKLRETGKMARHKVTGFSYQSMQYFIYAVSSRTSISCCLEAFKSSSDFLKPKIEKVCSKAAIF